MWIIGKQNEGEESCGDWWTILWLTHTFYVLHKSVSIWLSRKPGESKIAMWLVEGNQPSVRHNVLTKDEDRKHMCACAYTGTITFYKSIYENIELHIKT